MPAAEYPIIKRTVTIGLGIVLVFVGGFVGWTLFSRLQSGALAPGKVIVSGYQKDIQHLEGGIVTKIEVHDGDIVKPNQILIQLSQTKAHADLAMTAHKLFENTLVLDRLEAELDNKSSVHFQLPAAATPEQRRLMAIQQAMFKTNMNVTTHALAIYKERHQQLSEQIKGAETRIVSTRQQLKFIDQELKDLRALAKKRLVRQSKLLALERESARLTGTVAEIQSQVAQLRRQQAEIIFERDKYRHDIQQKRLAEFQEAHQHTVQMKEQYVAQKDILKRTAIRSPITGMVTGLSIHTVGAVIKPGDILMSIVPQDRDLMVEVRVSPTDIDIVHSGLQADVRFIAFNQRTTPTLMGKVTYVSPTSITQPETGQSYYLAQIEIQKSEFKKLGQDEKLYPGMPVEALIVTKRQTPWDYFFSPVQRSFQRAFKEG